MFPVFLIIRNSSVSRWFLLACSDKIMEIVSEDAYISIFDTVLQLILIRIGTEEGVQALKPPSDQLFDGNKGASTGIFLRMAAGASQVVPSAVFRRAHGVAIFARDHVPMQISLTNVSEVAEYFKRMLLLCFGCWQLRLYRCLCFVGFGIPRSLSTQTMAAFP